MALLWNWAFGPETALVLNDEMGFDLSTTSPSYIAPSQDFVYSYPGSPERWSLSMYTGQSWDPPGVVSPPEGIISVALYINGTSYNTNNLIYTQGPNNNRTIYFKIESNTVKLYVDNTFKEQSAILAGLTKNWNVWSLKYSMTASTNWLGQVYYNGVAVTAEQYDNPHYGFAETSANITVAAVNNANREAYYAQVLIYDSIADSASAVTPFRYATRVNPTIDTSEVGTWTPTGGASNFSVLSSSFDITKFTSNTGSATGNKVVCQVSGAAGLITQLGTTPSTIEGITLHGWASGSGQFGFVGLSDNNSVYATGSQITPDISDPTYTFASAATQPSNSAVWHATSSLYIKYEVN